MQSKNKTAQKIAINTLDQYWTWHLITRNVISIWRIDFSARAKFAHIHLVDFISDRLVLTIWKSSTTLWNYRIVDRYVNSMTEGISLRLRKLTTTYLLDAFIRSFVSSWIASSDFFNLPIFAQLEVINSSCMRNALVYYKCLPSFIAWMFHRGYWYRPHEWILNKNNNK